MEPLEIRDVFGVINHSRSTEVQAEPVVTSSEGWSVYTGYSKSLGHRTQFEIVYLSSKTTKQGLEEAYRRAKDLVRFVVHAPSLIGRLANLTKFTRSISVLSTNQFLRESIKEELQAYIEKLSDQAPAVHIDPRIESPSGFLRKLPNPLLSLMTDDLPSMDKGALGILLAEPGQGKTHLCRYLVSELSNRGITRQFVPLMVDSSQWDRMAIDDQRSIWKTITNSLKHFEAPIPWVEGHEDEFLRVALKAGLFRIIFDGLDEYLLRNRETVQAIDVLDALKELASNTGARILITSRTSFWHTALNDDVRQRVEESENVYVYTLLPFDEESAKRYFSARLKETESQRAALNIFNELCRDVGDNDVVGRGFVLNLIADVADRPYLPSATQERSLDWLISELCAREQLRQSLPIASDQQIEAFRLFAYEKSRGGGSTSASLDMALEFSIQSLEKGSRTAIIEKLKHHPLLTYSPKTKLWSFTQEQVETHLLVGAFLAEIDTQIANLLSSLKLSVAKFSDMVAAIVSVLHNQDEQTALRRLELIVSLTPVESDLAKLSSPFAVHPSFLPGLVSLSYIEKRFPKGSLRADRSSLLFSIFGSRIITNRAFTGTVTRLDLQEVRFEKCIFQKVIWANCVFSAETQFSRCTFVGGASPAFCTGFGHAKFTDCTFDTEANAMVSHEQIKEGSRLYTKTDLKSDISSLIAKFLPRNRVGFKTIEARNLKRGSISGSRHNEKIDDEFTKSILAEHMISGTSERGFHVREDAKESLQFFSANNSFTGALRTVFEKLCADLQL